ncbi:MAG: CPBP family intramembrane metalloprotease [Anaerolineae bacterium]|jgi:hypothetical protein
MRSLQRFAAARPLPFVLLAMVAWIVIAGLAVLVAARVLHVPSGGNVAQSLGMLTATACLLWLMRSWGWLRVAGVTALGSRRLWMVTAGLTVYVVIGYQIGFFGGIALNTSSPWDSGVAQSILAGQAVVGIAEEFLFRGLLLCALVQAWGKSRRGLLAAVTVPALLFGLTHIAQVSAGNPLDDTLMTMLNGLVSGLWYGAFVLLGGSIWPAVLFHAASNASFQIAAASLPGFDPAVTDYAAATAFELPLVIAGLWLLLRKMPGFRATARSEQGARLRSCAPTITQLLLSERRKEFK